jgi:hypothetical protein
MGVIPGKLAIPPEADQSQAEASDRESRKIKNFWIPALRPYSGHAFAGMTVERSLIYFANFNSRISANSS